VRRYLGQPCHIEVQPLLARDFEIELDGDVPKHRSWDLHGQWVETDAETLDASLGTLAHDLDVDEASDVW